MSFNHQWHSYDVARLWPQGSVVLLRNKMNTALHHKFAYLLISNWAPAGSFWARRDNEYQLIEEPRTNERDNK